MKSSTATNLVPTAYGSPFEGGFYGGKIRIGGAVFGIAWAPKKAGQTKAIWLPSYTDVPNAASCFDSMANTIAMAEAGSEVAQGTLELEINGVKGWCLPARDVLEMGHRYLKPGPRKNVCSFRDGDNPSSIPPGYPYTPDSPAQTMAEAFRKGGAEAFDETWYLSSTQSSATYCWGQSFGNGNADNFNNLGEAVARPCRLIQLTD